MSDPEETVVIVNERDEVIGNASRSRMRRERLIHRTTYIFVFSSRGELLVQERTLGKDMYPGWYDLAAGGVLVPGETYEESAYREAEEELGLRGVALTDHFKMYYEDETSRSFGRAYSCVYDGPFELQPEEVASAHFVNPDSILSGEVGPLTPDSRAAFERLRAPGADSRTSNLDAPNQASMRGRTDTGS